MSTPATAGGALLRGGEDGNPVSIVVRDCTFASNYNARGGGLFIGRAATGTVERCSFLDNTAFSSGGGAFKGGQMPASQGETVVFSYCLFAGNRAGWSQDDEPLAGYGTGGGFTTRLGPRAEFHNCTFADNLSGPLSVHLGDAYFHSSEDQGFTTISSAAVSSTASSTARPATTFRSARTPAASPRCSIAPGSPASSSARVHADQHRRPLRLAVRRPGCVASRGRLAVHRCGGGTRLYPRYRPPRGAQGTAPDIGAYERVYPVGIPDVEPQATPAAVSLHPARPNPANPRAAVSFTLTRPGSARLSVHDLAGRHVAVLVDGRLEAGDYNAAWDGRDANGRAMPSGLYYLRLAANGSVATQKLMLVR